MKMDCYSLFRATSLIHANYYAVQICAIMVHQTTKINIASEAEVNIVVIINMAEPK